MNTKSKILVFFQIKIKNFDSRDSSDDEMRIRKVKDKTEKQIAVKKHKKWWCFKRKKTDISTDPLDKTTYDDELQLLKEDSDIDLMKVGNTVQDSDYYSSDSSTNYSYSYQNDKSKYENVFQTPKPFRDLEKQEIPDYASMESYRTEPDDDNAARNKTIGTSISNSYLDKSKTNKHVDFKGVPTIQKEKSKLKTKRKKIPKKTKYKTVPYDTDIDSEEEFKEDTPLIERHLQDWQPEKNKENKLKEKVFKPEQKELAEERADKKTKPDTFSTPESVESDSTDQKNKKDLIEEPSLVEARLKDKEPTQKVKLPWMDPALCLCSDSDEELQYLKPPVIDSSLITVPQNSTTGVNSEDQNELNFQSESKRLRKKLKLQDIPTVSEVCTCRKSSEKFPQVQYAEINESPRSSLSSNTLTSSSYLSSLSDYRTEQIIKRPKKKNTSMRRNPIVNYVRMDYEEFPTIQEIELKHKNKIRQYYKAMKDVPAKKIISFSTPSRIRAMIEKIITKVYIIVLNVFFS